MAEVKKIWEQYGITKEQYFEIVEPYKVLLLALLQQQQAKVLIDGSIHKMD